MPSLLEFGPVVLEKIFQSFHCFSLCRNYLSWENVVVFYLRNFIPLYPILLYATYMYMVEIGPVVMEKIFENLNVI